MNSLFKYVNRMAKPNSKSHKAKLEKEKLLTVGTVSCYKCGDTHTTLYRVEGEDKKYICKNCKNKMEKKK